MWIHVVAVCGVPREWANKASAVCCSGSPECSFTHTSREWFLSLMSTHQMTGGGVSGGCTERTVNII